MGKDKKEYNFADVLTNGVLLDKILEIRRETKNEGGKSFGT